VIRAAIMLAAVAAPAALAAGLMVGERKPAESTLAVAERRSAPLVTQPGRDVEDAARYFARLNVPPPPPPPPPASIPPPPPPPEPGPFLRREISAVVGGVEGRELSLLLAGGKRLSRGDVYRDGWVLSGISNQTATLTKANEVRTVNLFAPAPTSTLQTAVMGPAPAPLIFSNGRRAGQMTSAQAGQFMNLLRQGGVSDQQLAALRQSMQGGGQLNGGQIVQLLQTAGRGSGRPGGPTVAQIQALARDLQNGGILNNGQVNQITQSVAQVDNNQFNTMLRQMQQTQQQQTQQNNNQRGGGGRGGRAPNAGFGGQAGRPAPPPPVTTTLGGQSVTVTPLPPAGAGF